MGRALRLVFILTVFIILAAQLFAEAQSGTKLWRIEYLSVAQVELDRSWVGAFRDGLRELGYVEGHNLIIEQRHAAGHSERLPELAEQLLRLKVDILVVYGAWLQPKKLPGAIPIVFTVAPIPFARGSSRAWRALAQTSRAFRTLTPIWSPSGSSSSRRSPRRHLWSRCSSIRAAPRPCSN